MIDTALSRAAWQELAVLSGPMVGLDTPYLVRGGDRFVREFPSSADILVALAGTAILRGAIEITGADKKVIPLESYATDSDKSGETVLVSLGAANSALDAGATIFLSKLNRTLPAVAAPADLDLPEGYSGIEIFAFITSPGTQSYSVHHDLLDSLIVQLEGGKSWRAWARSKGVRPGDGHVLYKAEGLGPADVETDLIVGDVILLPANAPHVAGTTHDRSFHLAVAFRQS